MRKRIAGCITGLLVLAFMTSSILATNSGDVMEQLNDSVNATNEWVQIEATVESYIADAVVESIKGSGKVLYNEAYKAYDFTQHDFIHAYDDAKSLEALISENYMWIVPTSTDAQFRVVQNNKGEWITAGYVESTGQDDRITTADMLSVAGQADKLQQALVSKRLISHMYYTEFIYMLTEGGEYVIPNCDRTDFTGLENGKVYLASEAVKTLREHYPEGEVGHDEDMGAGAGTVTIGGNWSEQLPLVLAIGLLSVALIGTIIVLLRRRSLNRK